MFLFEAVAGFIFVKRDKDQILEKFIVLGSFIAAITIYL